MRPQISVTIDIPATAPPGAIEETSLTAVSATDLLAAGRVTAYLIAGRRTYLLLIRH